MPKAPRPRKRQVCRKILLAWSPEEESYLIENVKQFPCLYDSNYENAMYRVMRSSAWESVAKALGKENATADECQAKWNSIRGSFRRILHRGNFSMNDEGGVKNGWAHIQAVDFLRVHIKPLRLKPESVFLQVHFIYFFNVFC